MSEYIHVFIGSAKGAILSYIYSNTQSEISFHLPAKDFVSFTTGLLVSLVRDVTVPGPIIAADVLYQNKHMFILVIAKAYVIIEKEDGYVEILLSRDISYIVDSVRVIDAYVYITMSRYKKISGNEFIKLLLR